MFHLGWEWWNQLRVQQKVWVILSVIFVPLVAALAVHVVLIDHLLTIKQDRQRMVLAREQIQVLRRLAVDIEDAFRGYLLTRQSTFLQPMEEAESRLQPAVTRTIELLEGMPELERDVRDASERLAALLKSKHELIRRVQAGHIADVLRYVRSGQGIRLSDAIRHEFRTIEDRLAMRLEQSEREGTGWTQIAFDGLLLAVAGVLLLGFIGARLLATSITRPLAVLQSSVASLGRHSSMDRGQDSIPVHSSDEIGKLARSFEEMARRIRGHIQELEALNAIGHEISTIGPDGLEGVLRRITDRAAELIHADVCLVMLRNEKMGCWIVEAASGEWGDRLYKSVMLWEEFPVSVQAFETKEPAFGENLRSDQRPEVLRRNLIGMSMLAVPLLSQDVPFGVLVLLQKQKMARDGWNVRLAKGFADEAAVAITNARLFETVKERGRGLQVRLAQLEHLAETLAHDLRSPGERMGELATILRAEYDGRLDDQGVKWLALIEDNSKMLSERVESILTVARVGGRQSAVEAVDPAFVINDILKARAGELEQRSVRVHVDGGAPIVACHRAYLHQIFDNLIANAVKFSADRRDPSLTLTWKRAGDRVQFAVADNGIGIPASQQQRVFEPFVRLDPAVTKGGGIGLTIVRRIVELYDGRVWVEPDLQEGCTVSFTLPILADLVEERHRTYTDVKDRIIDKV